MLHAVIMAGGTGTRFWPRSTVERPKQFLKIFSDRTLLQETFDRIEPEIPAEHTLVITNERYVGLVKEQLPEVPESNIVGEPVARNTAPCVAIAAAMISGRDPSGTMVVLPADHRITRPGEFRSILNAAATKARQGDFLVTIGIKPDRPETGYGYIESKGGRGEQHIGQSVLQVRQFREKPDQETAGKFLEAGNFYWNSGMFIWKADTVISQFKQHLPEIYKQVEAFLESKKSRDNIEAFYRECPSISIDYGIMEKADQVFVVPGDFGWSDVGSWRAVYDLKHKDTDGNVASVKNLLVQDAKNNLVESDSDKVFALVGVDNLAIVETDDAFLICNLDEAQGVKQIVEALKEDETLKKYL